MSFSFSFSGDDIEDEESLDSNETSNHVKNGANQTSPSMYSPDVLATQLQDTTLATTLLPPKKHTLRELLISLPSQVSYNYINIPYQTQDSTSSTTANLKDGVDNASRGRSVRVPRRSLFDIRQQLMAESDPSNNDDERGSLLAGLETGDLRSGIYEGGFKTWECAVDLAGFVGSELESDSNGQEGVWRVIELGAGSAVPSLVLLHALLARRVGGHRDRSRRVKFTLCDYNEDVLRLGTAVNIFLTTMFSGNADVLGDNIDQDGEIEVDQESIMKVLEVLEGANIEVDFVSGAWGDEFVQLTKEDKDEKDSSLLVLASETIYSPGSLRVFSQTILDILRTAQGDNKVYIAAKKVYFGVGGGVQEFDEEIKKLGGAVKTVLDIKSSGVGRVVLEVLVDE